MTKRPIPTLKTDNELDNFINEVSVNVPSEIVTPKAKNEKEKKEVFIKKSLVLKSTLDDALRLESAKTKITQIQIMEEAIEEYLKKKGYENI